MRHALLFALAVSGLSACVDIGDVAAPRPSAVPSASINCGPEITCDEETGDGPFGAPWGVHLGTLTPSYCRGVTPGSWPDLNGNDIRDDCELPLARAFAPMMVQGSTEMFHPGIAGVGMTAGDYLWAIAGLGDVVRIAYLPAYYWDAGVLGQKGGHSGDSEYIIVDVKFEPNGGKYYSQQVFLSAHCGVIDPMCRWFHTSYFEFVDGVWDSAPIVWVADWKNAHYSSFYNCMSGTYVDRCDAGPRHRARFPVDADFQILPTTRGIRARRAGAPWVDPNAIEDMNLRGGTFNGWQLGTWGDRPKNYGEILRQFGVFPPHGEPPAWECGLMVRGERKPHGASRPPTPRSRTSFFVENC
jgi:hypothetical protein